MKMKKVLVVYDTQFGNTMRLAEEIAIGIQENERVTCKVVSQKNIDIDATSAYDGFVFGGPVHAFRATRGILGAIKKIAKIGLDDKIVSTFDTHMAGNESRAVNSMEKLLKKIAPRARIDTPGYSGRVDGFRGPLDEAVVPEARTFGTAFAREIIQNHIEA